MEHGTSAGTAEPATGEADRPSWRRTLVGLLVLGLFALGVRWAVLEAASPVELMGDEPFYLSTAISIDLGYGFGLDENHRADWPPAHSWVLSHFVDSDRPRQTAFRPAKVKKAQRVEVPVLVTR